MELLVATRVDNNFVLGLPLNVDFRNQLYHLALLPAWIFLFTKLLSLIHPVALKPAPLFLFNLLSSLYASKPALLLLLFIGLCALEPASLFFLWLKLRFLRQITVQALLNLR